MNKYRLFSDYGIGYTRKGNKFYFDLDDYELIRSFTWWIDGQGYVRTEKRIGKRKVINKMHNFVMGFSPSSDRIIDHINRNKNDNRKVNLRVVTKQENALNAKIQVNNSSGIRGVSLNKNGYWESYITFNGKRIHLKISKNMDVAITARLMAEKKYFGDSAPQKHLFEKYGVLNHDLLI